MSADLGEFITKEKFGVRGEQFAFIAANLIRLNRPVVIVETGSLRPSETPDQDGQSTLIWDWVVEHTGGKCFTVDINPIHSSYTRSLVGPKTEIVNGDSIHALSSFMPPVPQMFDLVYLDSMDWTGTDQDKLYSSLHHVGELAAIWPHIATGGIIAVDDCYGAYEGKQALVECFFNLLRVGPVMTGPIYAWVKPPVLSK